MVATISMIFLIPENQLTTNFAFLSYCITVPLVMISSGERRSPKKYLGNGVPPRLYHWFPANNYKIATREFLVLSRSFTHCLPDVFR